MPCSARNMLILTAEGLGLEEVTWEFVLETWRSGSDKDSLKPVVEARKGGGPRMQPVRVGSRTDLSIRPKLCTSPSGGCWQGGHPCSRLSRSRISVRSLAVLEVPDGLERGRL
jgi:hypothetical protein